MGFAVAIRTCLKKYFVFSGRAGRAEYWWFYLFATALGLIPVVGLFVSVLVAIPGLSAAVRRLHDIGRSGWWLGALLAAILIPAALVRWVFDTATLIDDANTVAILFPWMTFVLLGFVGLLYWLSRPGQIGPNRYGPDPSGQADPQIFA